MSNSVFVGRDSEMAALRCLLDSAAPTVIHISGEGGIGKTLLLDRFADEARQCGASVVHLDCRELEPSPPGFLHGLAAASGATDGTLECVAERLNALGSRVVLILDTYELFWLMDAYIRRILCPLLGPRVRIVTAGRDAPQGPWLTSPEWQGRFRTLALGPLADHEAVEYLRLLGFERAAARRINSIARGLPIALTMAASLGPRGGRSLEDAAVTSVDQLARQYLESVDSPGTREALEAASVLRRTTESLLRATLPDAAPSDLVARLSRLPFVDLSADGLFVHDAVRDAVSTWLSTTDPDRHREYRVRAWRYLRQQIRDARGEPLWRFTADILYLLQKPEIRDGFFPAGYPALAVEPAMHADHAAIATITGRHTGPEEREVLMAWLTYHPEVFFVTRDTDGSIAGWYILIQGSALSESVITADPVAAAWVENLSRRSDPKKALFIRTWLDSELGKEVSGTQGAIGLDAKRTYMAMRPNLRYIYIGSTNHDNLAWCDALHFTRPPDTDRVFDGKVFSTRLLDMGPGSVDSWLSLLVADDLGIDARDDAELVYDRDARELLVGDRRIPLTNLECGVLALLWERSGKAVSRADLMEHVWGYGAETSSNVVDALVAGLRKKMGPQAAALETVRGTGYRLRIDP